MSPAVILLSASFAMGLSIGALYLTWVKINTPEPARADDETARWMHQLVGPARVMADPVLSRLAVLGRAVADAARSRDTMACGCAPGGPSCQWWAGQLHPLNVSGPAELAQPPQAEAGPETPHPVTSAAGNHRPAATGVTSLPPVDQAAHLQPIDWRDATGSFRAACAGDYR